MLSSFDKLLLNVW